MRTALALVLLLAATDLASAKCARPAISSVVVTAKDAKLAADGGVLIGVSTLWQETPSGAEDGKNPKWRFVDANKKEYVPVLVELAPGLVVYQPPAGATGALTLVDGKTEKTTLTVTADKAAPLGGPDVKSVKLSTFRELRGGTRLQLDAVFTKPAPAGVQAVVVFASSKTGNVARSWGRVVGGAKTVKAAGTAGRCDPGIPGEVMGKVGDKIVLAWVDANGRLSKLSRPVTVQKGSQPKGGDQKGED